MPQATLDAHLGACAGCRAWVTRVAQLTRSLRLHPAQPVPDLTAPILAAIAAERATAPAPSGRLRALVAFVGGEGGDAPWVIRLALLLIAAAQVLIAVPALFGNDLGATIHVAHEQGAWGLALAAGLAFGAWRPARATAMVPLLVVFVLCMGLMTMLDIAGGRVTPSAEVPHLIAALGLGLVWLESHPPLGLRRPALHAAMP